MAGQILPASPRSEVLGDELLHLVFIDQGDRDVGQPPEDAEGSAACPWLNPFVHRRTIHTAFQHHQAIGVRMFLIVRVAVGAFDDRRQEFRSRLG